MKTINLKDTAKLIRQELKDKLPKGKFSVKTKSTKGNGNEIFISWIDGYRELDVNAIVDNYRKYKDYELDGEKVRTRFLRKPQKREMSAQNVCEFVLSGSVPVGDINRLNQSGLDKRKGSRNLITRVLESPVKLLAVNGESRQNLLLINSLFNPLNSQTNPQSLSSFN